MEKKITASELRNQLGILLDRLEEGHSHFVVERNNREVAVLLSIEKFREIMQMLELLNTLDFIEPGSEEENQERASEFPDLQLLPPLKETPPGKRTGSPARSHGQEGHSIEDVAARLGIRVIK